MGELQSRRSLRRTQASVNLRGQQDVNPHNTSAIRAWDIESPVTVRRMSSHKTSTPLVPSLELQPRTRTSSVSHGRHRDHLFHAAHAPVFELDGHTPNHQRHRHKDSAITLEQEEALDQSRSSLSFPAPRLQSPTPSFQIDDIATTLLRKASLNDTASISSTIRFSVHLPKGHPLNCCCITCRQIRHQRRKTSLRLSERLEACRLIAIAIRDPRDPANEQRGLAWRHWERLGKLFVKYDALICVPIGSIAEEEDLLEHYVRAFSRVVQFVEDERSRWWHLFTGGYDEIGKAAVYKQTRPQLTEIRPASRNTQYSQV